MAKVKSGLEYRRIGEDGLILDTHHGTFYRLSSDAVPCWERMVAGHSTEGVCAHILEFAEAGLVSLDADEHVLGQALNTRSLEALQYREALAGNAN